MSRYRKKTNRLDFLTRAEVERMIALARTPRDRAILRVLADEGMRVGELVELDAGDILWADRVIQIRWQECISAERRRLIPASDAVLAALEAHLGGLTTPDETPVFRNPSGNRLSARPVESLVQKLGREITSRGAVTPHTLRHSLATHWIESGGSIVALQNLLGHSSVSTTRGYMHGSAAWIHGEYERIMR